MVMICPSLAAGARTSRILVEVARLGTLFVVSRSHVAQMQGTNQPTSTISKTEENQLAKIAHGIRPTDAGKAAAQLQVLG